MTAIYDQMPEGEGDAVIKSEGYANPVERVRGVVAEVRRIVGVELVHPSEPRRDTPMPIGYENTPIKEARIRKLAESIGVGALKDVTPDMLGVPKNHKDIIEGGLIWKMQSEIDVALESGGEGAIILSASRFELAKDDELAKLSALTGKPIDELQGVTQYEVMHEILVQKSEFSGVEDTSVLDEKLMRHNVKDIPEDFDSQGGIVFVGQMNGRDVYAYDVPRRRNPDNPDKYQQFAVSDIIQHISLNDLDGDNICYVTSTTYLPTRALQCDAAIRAGVNGVHVVAYGQEKLAKYKTGGIVTQVELNQILGEVASTDKLVG